MSKIAHHREWFAACKMMLEQLMAEYHRVHVIGLSLGGTTGTWLGEQFPNEPKLASIVLPAPGWEIYDRRFMAMDLTTEPG